MTHVTIEKEKLEKVLEALEPSSVIVDSFGLQKKMQEAHATIKQAFAAPVHFAWMRYEADCAGDPVLVVARSTEEGAFKVYKEPTTPPAAPVQGPSGDYLSDFQEGQWWLAELDAAVVNGTHDQKRAVAVARNLLATVAANTPPSAQPAVPDPIHHTDLSEHPEYISGWNDFRQAMLEMMK